MDLLSQCILVHHQEQEALTNMRTELLLLSFLKKKTYIFLFGWVGSWLWSVVSFVAAHELTCSRAHGILVPWPGIKPMSPALEGRFLTTEPPGKSHKWPFSLRLGKGLANQLPTTLFWDSALFSTKRIIYWFISLLIVGFPPLECHLYWTESFVSTAAGTQSVVNNLLLNGKGNRSSHQCGSNEVHPVWDLFDRKGVNMGQVRGKLQSLREQVEISTGNP